MMLILLAVLAAAATAFVMQPLFGAAEAAGPGASDPEVLRLLEKREQLLVALAELDFEKDAGKIAVREHRTSRTQLLAEAAAVTARLDALGWAEAGETAGDTAGETPGETPA